ncbi:MAG: hypothetical protein HC927_11155 [Deltaproteobacteria bacterium]|nr:hypothetical protein [Deltaproteobacteria bacterium]
MNIAAGAKLVMNVHYHPTGEDQLDTDTAIELRLAKARRSTSASSC